MTALEFLRDLVGGGGVPPSPIASAASLRAHLAGATREDTVEDASLAGAASETMGWAFAAGYQAALRRLDPRATSGGRLASLCVTEQGGGHPRAIQCALARATRATPSASAGGGWTLSGEKTWVTLGADADVLLVVATTGLDPSGRNALRVARIPADRAGITREAAPPLPFASFASFASFATEVGHGRARFDRVVVDDAELLEGDGYTGVLKPFRTIEDVHVTAAVAGWSIAVARRSGWSRAWIAEAAGIVALLRELNAAPALAPPTHVALAGALLCARRLLESAEWSRADERTRESWERDRPLLDVAARVRAARFEAAWLDMLGDCSDSVSR
jgi:alkylation response protein AidB-like acyl-CoA dehydrogenase